jgi:hypothetical protein
VSLQGVPRVDNYVTSYLLDPSKLPADGACCKVTSQ